MAKSRQPYPLQGDAARKVGLQAARVGLTALKVLEYAAAGGNWYERVQRELLDGWRPRHPDTGEILNAENCLAWALKNLGREVKVQSAADLALIELEHMASGDVAMVALADVHEPRDIATLPESLRRAIAGWKWDARGKFVLVFHSKLDAIRLLLQAAGRLIEKHEVGGKDGGPITVIERKIVDAQDTDR